MGRAEQLRERWRDQRRKHGKYDSDLGVHKQKAIL